MSLFTGRYWLVFSSENAHDPVICEMVRKFDITFNIRQASISAEVGIIALELQGEHQVVKDAIQWLESRGVKVDPVELQTIEG